MRKKTTEKSAVKRQQISPVDDLQKIQISNAAHDLRTPLSALYGSLQILQYINKDQKCKRYIDHAIKNCKEMQKRIEEFASNGKNG